MSSLEHYYNLINTIILSRQHPVTGLIPASTGVTVHGDYRDAWVRDNVYSILAVYCLSLAYKKVSDDKGRTILLEKSVIKCMRGLLLAMMRQADKVENFKNSQSREHALHAKYGTSTGMPIVGDHQWGHLQIDATSLFLLQLAQMTASGLQIVYTLDEVDFIQNLVYYIERAYRTPDYGIWERGNKINHGELELNSSSIGMAVAALQAINRINLMGARGGPESIIHVLPDEIIRNYTILTSFLPRESNSKEVDSSVLSIIGYPGFAVHDQELIDITKAEILTKLKGKYGCKRFLRDGHQTVLEDTSRLHFNSHELKQFEGIESEWPLFYTYLVLEAIFRNDWVSAIYFREELEPLLLEVSTCVETKTGSFMQNIKLVPELYFVPLESVEEEKKNPQSQDRLPNTNVPLVWAQSLKACGDLLFDNLVSPAELDPLDRRNIKLRSSRFNSAVQLALLAEDESLQASLLSYGIETQTACQVQPITICSASSLRNAYTFLGANKKLKLTGRPKRPVGTLSTCKFYSVSGRLYVFTPHFMDMQEFYLSMDNEFLVSTFETETAFISQNWCSAGVPTIIVMLTHSMLSGPHRYKKCLLQLIAKLRTGTCAGTAVKLGKLREFANTSCIESLDFLISGNRSSSIAGHTGDVGDEFHPSELEQSILKPLAQVPQRKAHLNPENSNLVRRRNASRSDRTARSRPHSPSASPKLVARRYSVSDKSLPSNLENLLPAGAAFATTVKETVSAQDLCVFKLASSEFSARYQNQQVKFAHHRFRQNEYPDDEGLLVLTLGNRCCVEEAQELLKKSNNMFDQIDILHYLHSCFGLHYNTGIATVKVLVEEIYNKAAALKLWSIVRHAAGLLRKVINSLGVNLSDLLIRQKQMTIGRKVKNSTEHHLKTEFVFSVPESPEKIADCIYSVYRDDIREGPLVQELLSHLASFIRAEPRLFDGILRIRTHYILEAIEEEIFREWSCSSREEALEELLQMTPFQVKSWLRKILTAKEQTKATDSKEESMPLFLTVTVQSAGYHDGNFATVRVQGKEDFQLNCGRGLNVAVVDRNNGNVVDVASFDTHIREDESEEFARFIEYLNENSIVLIAAKDDAFQSITESALLACESIGSSAIRRCNFRDSWCIIGEKGAPIGSVPESHNISKSKVQGAPLTTTINLDVESTKRLLQQGPSKGSWIRRRKIDGSLDRVPTDFYPKIWRVLEKCHGIEIHGYFLPRDPIICEMTPQEYNFSLAIENLLDAVHDPAERQIAIECLLMLAKVEERNPEIDVTHDRIKVDKIIKEAVHLCWKKNCRAILTANSIEKAVDNFEEYESIAKSWFYDLPIDGRDGTLSYLTVAAVRTYAGFPFEIDLTNSSSSCLIS